MSLKYISICQILANKNFIITYIVNILFSVDLEKMGICCLPIIDINSYAIIGKIIIKLKFLLISI